ncbi:RNA polymerase sigma factor [Elusimicrobiota bacterium]
MNTTSSQPEPDEDGDDNLPVQKDLLQKAYEAAASGKADETVEALFSSRAVDGLVRQLHYRWINLSETDVRFAVAQGIEVLLADIRGGKKILDLMSYLYKVAHRKAIDIYRARTRLARRHGLDQNGDPVHTDSEDTADRSADPLEILTAPAPDSDGEERRKVVLAAARRLLPRVGEGNILSIGEYILDSIAEGYKDLSYRQVADAVGLSVSTVRVLVSRFWERMEREAKREGWVGKDFTALSLLLEEPDLDDEGEDDEVPQED